MGKRTMAKTKKAVTQRQRTKRRTVRRSTAAPPRGPTRTAIRGFVTAAARGDLAAVQAVLTKLPQLACEPESLFAAAANGHAAVVRGLLDGGADANAISPDEHRCRPVHRVIQHDDNADAADHLEVVKVLLEHGGADACARATPLNVSAIALAAIAGRRQFLPLLLPYLERWDIFTAAVLGEARHVATILQRNPEQATAVDPHNGMTALDYATASRLGEADPQARARLSRVAQMLIDAGAADASRIAAEDCHAALSEAA
jgi:ankyrin repeat protein